ncbi:MAG TPA: sigma 54-interacting transcriptional regulator [Smithellaceae bacterium]|nr:sigma 54-interacting transcriptional regulator [Smithellaceae bacterium]HRS89688.1 sigma 54-interacting transcriptional regulator [Smithellaceae bacterium]HRV25241.1 sigma 54-interacting transcriptional regulator [Smithellaceae bacterium]
MSEGKSREEYLKSLEAMLNEIEDGVGEVDIKGNLLYINDAGCRFWGYSREEIIGTSYKSYTDQEGIKVIREAYNKVYKTGEPLMFIHNIVRSDGLKRIMEDFVSPVKNDNGEVIGFRSVQRDVTDRIEAEKRFASHRRHLEAIFGSVKDAIITVDREQRVIEINKSAEDICGIDIQDVGGKVFSECIEQCEGACTAVLKQTLEKQQPFSEFRIECGHQSRYQQLVSINSTPLLDYQGNFTGAVMVIRDITLLRDLQRELRERHKFQNIIGRSESMQDIYHLLEDLASLETTVLITGESGTGKELVARALHYSGQRSFKPFITVNCSALAESLLESELFGHVRGAFTGAVKDKQGRFEAADGGTILLDEIGDISPLIQLKLLRVLQEKVFERVGESTPRKVDVRVIASTNRNLKEKVKKGEFREDLFYRLMVVEVALPPLRERLEDLPLLVDHFIHRFNEEFKKEIEGISRDVLNKFMEYSWPGNVRELEHALEHAFILCRGKVIALEHLPVAIRDFGLSGKIKEIGKTAVKKPTSEQKIMEAIDKAGGNKAKAARLLGINRRTLYRKISKKSEEQ